MEHWTDKFNHVIGVVHTKYLEYIKCKKFGALPAFLVKHINNLVAKKLVLTKGYKELIDLLEKHINDLGGFRLDVYGNGVDSLAVRSAAKILDLSLSFLKGRDHADDSLHGYKVFINPSISNILCTATAEALALGKFVICTDYSSNDFSKAFPNCLTYKTSEDCGGSESCDVK